MAPPIVGGHAWEVFWSVWDGHRASYQEIEAYSRLTGDTLDPWEVSAIRSMDSAVARVMSERVKKK